MFVAPEEINGGLVTLSQDDYHHLWRVVRLQTGDRLEVCDGQGRVWHARLLPGGRAQLVEGPDLREAPKPSLHVLQALPKGRKLDEVIEALVELGVERITPVVAERSVPQLTGEKRKRARRRWTAVARAAATQSRRAWLPVVSELDNLESAAAGLVRAHVSGVVAHVGVPTPLASALAALPPDTGEVAVAIGPEGGWTDAEVDRWRSSGLEAITLGATVLRTEHAAFGACAAISYALGRMT